MTQLTIWLLLCTIVTFSLQRRPIIVLSIVLAMRLAIPSQVGWLIIGDWEGNAAIHPSTILLISWSAIALMSRLEDVGRELRQWRGTYLTLAFVSTFFVIVAVFQSGLTSLFGLTNSLLAAMLFFFMVRVVARQQANTAKVLLRLFISVMIAEAFLVILQWAVQASIPWSLVHEFPVLTRPLGTFDSPLDLALACAIAIPLMTNIRTPAFRYGGGLLLLAATVLSESRTPTAIAAAGFLYLIIRSFASGRAVIAVTSVAAIGIYLALTFPVLSGLVERITGDDGNSLAARSVATEYILSHLSEVLWVGNGWGSSYALKGSELATSLENGYAILAFDLGALAVAALFLTQLRVALGRGAVESSWFAGIAAISGGFIYSGITTMSAISLITWTVLAFCRKDASQEAGEHGSNVARRPAIQTSSIPRRAALRGISRVHHLGES